MHRFVLLFAIAALLPGVTRANSMAADPTKKDLCGVYVGEVDDGPIVLDLQSTGFSRWTLRSDDGRVISSVFTWLCLPHGELRFQLQDDERPFVLPIEGALVSRVFWDKLTILCGAADTKLEKRKIEFKRLSTAERKLGPLLVLIEQAQKREANRISEPTAETGRGSP